MKDFINNNRPRFVLLVVLGVFLLAILGTILTIMISSKNGTIAASYQDVNITTTAYEKALEQCKKGMEFAKDDRSQDRCTEKTISELLVLEALRKEAKAKNIDVSEEIEKDYQEFYKPYGSEEIALAEYKMSFALEKEDIKNNIEREALKDALGDTLIKKVSIAGSFVSYDFFKDELGYDLAVTRATDLVKKYYQEPMKEGATVKELLEVAKRLRKENPSYDSETATKANITTEIGLNDSNYDEFFADGNTKDWEEIKKLEKVGDVTPIFTSPNGLVIIWRLESTNGGRYNSWEHYQAEILKESKTYSLKYNFLKTKLAILKVVAPTAYAACVNHMGGIDVDNIYFYSTTTPIAPGSVKVHFAKGSTGDCNANCSSALCSGDSYPGSNNFLIGNGSSYLNCNAMWNIKFETRNNTFYPVEYINRAFPDNAVNIKVDRNLFDCMYDGGSNDCEVYVKFWSNSTTFATINNDTSEFSDEDKIIVVRPIGHRLTVNINGTGSGTVTTPGGGINCSYNGTTKSGDCVHDFVVYNNGTTLTPTATQTVPGSTFVGWAGDVTTCNGKTGNCSITYGGNNITVLATFNKPPTYTITPSADTGCSISPSTVQTVNKGGSASFSGSALSPYTYQGFSIDGGAITAGGSYTFLNVVANHTIRARCTNPDSPTFNITPSADTGCSISPSTVQTVNKGGSASFTGSAQSGYTYKGFAIDGAASTTDSSYTFSNVQADHTIHAQCNPVGTTPTTYTITPSADTGCSISPSTTQTVNQGGSASFSADAASAAYYYDGLSIDGGATSATGSYTFSNVTANHTIRAKCNEIPTVQLVSPLNPAGSFYYFPSTTTDVTLQARGFDDSNNVRVGFYISLYDGSPVPGVTYADPSVKFLGWSDYGSSGTQRTWSVGGLTKDTAYIWGARAQDGTSMSQPYTASFKIMGDSSISCAPTPNAGDAALSVLIKYTINYGNLSDVRFDPDGGGPLPEQPHSGTDGTHSFKYTYEDPGNYSGTITQIGGPALHLFGNPNTLTAACDVKVGAKKGGSSDGNEVTP